MDEKKLKIAFLGLFLSLPNLAYGKNNLEGRIPDEYESVGGHAVGMANAGVAAVTGQSSVRTNPAMLTMEKGYSLTTGYHWPTAGREFYEIGVIDTTTADIGAGLTYTAPQDEYQGFEKNPYTLDSEKGKEYEFNRRYDTPIKKRISLGIGKGFEKIAAGFGVQVIDAWDLEKTDEEKASIKGTTLGLGVAGLIYQNLRFALSSENMGNGKVKNYAPKTYRAGLAYLVGKGDVTIHLDYKDRERVAQEQMTIEVVDLLALDEVEKEDPTSLKSEKTITPSFSARIQNLLRIMGGYSHEIGGDRRLLSGGIALVNQKYSLSYLVTKPYLENEKLHQAVNLSFNISM